MAIDPASAFFTFVDAVALAQEVFEVLQINWGLRVTDPNPAVAYANLQYPPSPAPGIPNSVAAVAIGPRSTIDRFWISYFRQKAFPSTVSVGGFPVFTRFVSLGSPLLFPQPAAVAGIGGVNSPNNASQVGAFYLFPRATNSIFTVDAPVTDPNLSTILPTQYVSGLDGTTLLPFDNSVGNHELPFLHAYLYVKPMRFTPGPRFPMQRSSVQSVSVARRCIGQLPIYGRRRLKFTWTSTTTTTLELGLLRGLFEVGTQNLEQIVAIDTGHTHGTFEINDPGADYLTIYGTGDGNGNVTYKLTALDDVSFT